LGGALAVVCLVPPAVGTGPFDFGKAARFHRPGFNQRLGLVSVPLGPRAPWPSSREALEPIGLVAAMLLSVDPAECQRDVECLVVRRCGEVRAFLRDLQPDASRGIVVFEKPGTEFLGPGELLSRAFFYHQPMS
jgi:hypothetical protein